MSRLARQILSSLVAVVLWGLAVPAGGQTTTGAGCASGPVEDGVLAYQELRLEEAARILRDALEGREGISRECPEYTRALAFLAATELYRGREDLAEDTFRRLALHDPRYRLDEVVFPPRVTEAFARARRRTSSVAVTIPRSTDLRIGLDSLRIEVFATSSEPLLVVVERVGGTERRTLYSGPGRDSLEVRWDGTISGNLPSLPGEYLLSVAPIDTTGAVSRAARLPLRVETVADATPLAPLGPLQAPRWGTAMSLGGALVGGALVVALPSLVGGGEGASWRFAVAGAMAASGLAGLMWGEVRQQEGWPTLRVLRGPATSAGGSW